MTLSLDAPSGLGWISDQPDFRDHIYALNPQIGTVPRHVDLRKQMPPVRNQGNLGACSSFATTSVVQYNTMLQNADMGEPSELFTYYNTRSIENTIPYDSGATIRDAIKSVNKYGCAKEELWPYDITKFKVKPPTEAYQEATQDFALKYERIVPNYQDRTLSNRIRPIRVALASGYPVVFGITVYESFMLPTNRGNIPYPNLDEQPLGGHAIVLCGYNENQQFLFRNSWGKDWGQFGYGTLPFSYVVNPRLAMDFWVVTSVGKESGL